MKQILIVEDDNLLNKTLTYNLELDGYTITSVLNARTRNLFRLVLCSERSKPCSLCWNITKPAKDIYEDGSLFLDFSEQFASLNGKPLALSAMEYKMLNLFLKKSEAGTYPPTTFGKAVGH